jgi:branched-chain amino acid transport system ATP-binding protein
VQEEVVVQGTEMAGMPQSPGDPELLIAARKLSAGYGSGPVIREIDIEVRAGEVVALLGPNGAGKTTTLLTLAGELRPTAGDVLWNGSPHWMPLHRRARQGMSFIPEGSVFGGLTTIQNLLVKREHDPEATLDLFPHLRPMLRRTGRLLSGGEQRMLAVGRALTGGARLLMADELTLGLAPLTSEVIFTAIRRRADEGIGALIVEQHVHRVLKFADRVYVLERGQIRLATTAAEAREQLEDIQSMYLSGPGAAEEAQSGGVPAANGASAKSSARSARGGIKFGYMGDI